MSNPDHRNRLIPKDRANQLLAPLYHVLYDAFEHSWNWVQKILDQDSDRRATFDHTTVAGMIYDRFVRLILPLVHGQPGIRVEKSGKMLRFRIGSEIILRFKRFDGKLRSRNVLTRSQQRIYDQEALFDMSDGATSLTFGYVLDRPRTIVHGVYVTCPVSYRKNAWMIPLKDESAGGGLLFTNPTPLPPSLPLPAAKKRGKKEGEAEAG